MQARTCHNRWNAQKNWTVIQLNIKQQDSRPPSAYFPPSNFAEDTFWKKESVLSRKFAANFDFCKKTLTSIGKKYIFLKENHLTPILQKICHLDRF